MWFCVRLGTGFKIGHPDDGVVSVMRLFDARAMYGLRPRRAAVWVGRRWRAGGNLFEAEPCDSGRNNTQGGNDKRGDRASIVSIYVHSGETGSQVSA